VKPTSAPVRPAPGAPEAVRAAAGTSACPPCELKHLSNREQQILAFVARGLTNSDVAKHLVLSPLTVKSHKARIAVKLGSCGESSHSVAIGWARGYLRALPRRPTVPPPLSPREYQILVYLANGLSNPQIAERLGRSHNTVKTLVGRLLRKLSARNRAHAVLIGFQTGLLHATPREGS
jgi:DNA-binding NarL/FixJ family response regulator